MSQTKSPRNRTLTVSADEADSLRRDISTPSMLSYRPMPDDLIVNGDTAGCLDLLPDAYFDLIILDPPYNISKDFGRIRFREMSAADYERYLLSWFDTVCDKLAPHGSLYMRGDWRCSAAMQRVIERRLTILNRITWQREKGRGAASNWKNSAEDIWFAVNNPAHYYFDVDAVKQRHSVRAPYRVDGQPKDWADSPQGRYRLTYPSNFWNDISVPFWSMPENTEHPTQKPEKLIAKLILASSAPGARILDPFMGSGTTAVVARKLGRHFTGIEINPEYCLLAAKRLRLAANSPEIQGYDGTGFFPRNP